VHKKSSSAGKKLYFSNITPSKQRRIFENITNKKELWLSFLEKKKMTVTEFKKLSNFKSKAITGFMHFLTQNDIASRFGDEFSLKEENIPYIQKIFEENK